MSGTTFTNGVDIVIDIDNPCISSVVPLMRGHLLLIRILYYNLLAIQLDKNTLGNQVIRNGVMVILNPYGRLLIHHSAQHDTCVKSLVSFPFGSLFNSLLVCTIKGYKSRSKWYTFQLLHVVPFSIIIYSQTFRNIQFPFALIYPAILPVCQEIDRLACAAFAKRQYLLRAINGQTKQIEHTSCLLICHRTVIGL